MDFVLPDLGDDAGNAAKVTFWYKSVGEAVTQGEDLVEMMTDKTTFNVPAPTSGTLKEIKINEDESVKVGETLGVIE